MLTSWRGSPRTGPRSVCSAKLRPRSREAPVESARIAERRRGASASPASCTVFIRPNPPSRAEFGCSSKQLAGPSPRSRKPPLRRRTARPRPTSTAFAIAGRVGRRGRSARRRLSSRGTRYCLLQRSGAVQWGRLRSRACRLDAACGPQGDVPRRTSLKIRRRFAAKRAPSPASGIRTWS
jgi:hypothetical protein